MADTIKQSIGIAPLRCAGRKVDSVSYSGGTVPEDGGLSRKVLSALPTASSARAMETTAPSSSSSP